MSKMPIFGFTVNVKLRFNNITSIAHCQQSCFGDVIPRLRCEKRPIGCVNFVPMDKCGIHATSMGFQFCFSASEDGRNKEEQVIACMVKHDLNQKFS